MALQWQLRRECWSPQAGAVILLCGSAWGCAERCSLCLRIHSSNSPVHQSCRVQLHEPDCVPDSGPRSCRSSGQQPVATSSPNNYVSA